MQSTLLYTEIWSNGVCAYAKNCTIKFKKKKPPRGLDTFD